MDDMKKRTNEQLLQGCLSSIYNEHFDFNFDSEEEEDEVFVGDVCFHEKCKLAVINDMCNVEAFPELTDEQWAHMKEQADLLVFIVWEDKQKNKSSVAPVVTTIQNNINLMQSSPITSSPALNTRSKRKMLISESPYKISPLQDITNRNIMKPSPGILLNQSLHKLVSSKLDTSTDLTLYDQLGLVNPMQLNFDDVEHSPKKSQCLNPYFTCQDSAFISDEAADGLLLFSPDLKQSQAMRKSLGISDRVSSDALIKKPRVRSKTYKLDDGNSNILPSLLCPNFSSSNAKESKTTLKNNNKVINDEVYEPDLKPPRKSLLNVSFTIDRDSNALLGMATSPTKISENVEALKEPTTLNESFTIKKSTCRESLLNESFTINKSYVCNSAGGKQALNESFTINKSIVRASLSGVSASLNESFTVNNSMNGKSTLNQSSTKEKCVKQDLVNDETTLNETVTRDQSHHSVSVNEKTAILNESFVIDNCKDVVQSLNQKQLLNEESFTINELQPQEIKRKSIMNESFALENSQTRKVLHRKSILNESFTLEKSTLNQSFIVDDSVVNKASTPVKGTILKKKSPPPAEGTDLKKKSPSPAEGTDLKKKSPPPAEGTDLKKKSPPPAEGTNLKKKSPPPAEGTNLKKKSPPPAKGTILKKKALPVNKPNSLNFSSSLNKSTSDKSNEKFQKAPLSRKRTLASVIKTPTRHGYEPPSKTAVVSRSLLNKSQMPTIKSSIVNKPISYPQFSSRKLNLKNPNLDFNESASTLQKDNHGMVKFQEKSVIPKNKLLAPTKLNRKSLKISPQKTAKEKEQLKIQSPVFGLKRKCLLSTPPISKIHSAKSVESSLNTTTNVPKTRLVLPSKLSSNIPRSDIVKQLTSKGPLKAFPTLSGKVFEMKQHEVDTFAGKSKLRMPSPVKRTSQINFKKS